MDANNSFEERVLPSRYREAARLVLPDPVFGWIDGVGGSGAAKEGNSTAFSKWKLVMRVLRDVSSLELGVDILGHRLAYPIMVAPLSNQRMIHPDGEIAMARGVAEAGTIAIFAVDATTDFAQIGDAAGESGWWLQLYNWENRDATLQVIRSAQSHGCTVLVPTVNTPVPAAHSRPGLGFALSPGLGPVNHPQGGTSPTSTHDLSYLSWLINESGMPVIPKGVLHPDDALRILESGASGIIVSNHGGRHGDQGVSSLDALPRVRRAVGPEATVLFDGGVYRGYDAAKALALGASVVLLGRAALWGLAVGGAIGVRRVIQSCASELLEELQLCGIDALDKVSYGMLERET